MAQDIQQYIPGLYSNSPITISAKHIAGSGGATRTIAPISSGFAADYSTDGVADEVEIQAAVDAVNALGGGLIFLRAGTYTITLGQKILMRSNVIVQGEGESTVIKFLTGSRFSLARDPSNSALVVPANNIKYLNFKIDCSGQTDANADTGITLFSNQNVEIAGLHIIAYGFGIDMLAGPSSQLSVAQDLSQIWVHHNFIQGCCRQDCVGGGPNSATMGSLSWRDVTIENNFLSQDTTLSYAGTSDYNAVDIAGVNWGKVSNNICEGAIYFGNDREPQTLSIINNNLVRPPHGTTTMMTGIVVQDENLASATSNRIEVSGNLLYGGVIHVSGKSGQPITNVNVVGNTVINSPTLTVNDQTGTLSQNAVKLEYANGCLVSGNMCYGPSVVANNGLLCNNSSNNLIVGNYVDGYSNSLSEVNTASNNLWVNNYLINFNVLGNSGISAGNIHNNFGVVTEAKGTATVANGATTSVVTHGLGLTPAAGNIVVTPTNNLGLAAKFYVDTYTSTQFTIHTDIDPGAGTATFAWLARI